MGTGKKMSIWRTGIVFVIALLISLLQRTQDVRADTIPEGTYTPTGSGITYTFAGANDDLGNGFVANVVRYRASVAIKDGELRIPSLISLSMHGEPSKYVRVGGILQGAFSGSTSLTKLLLPDTMKNIGQEAFSNCPNLSSIQTYSDLIGTDEYSPSAGYLAAEEIGYRAFYGCSSLTDITLGEKIRGSGGVETVQDEAFMNCGSLKSVEIGQTVTWIEDSAFANCSSLDGLAGGVKIRDNPLYFVQDGMLYYRESNRSNVLVLCPAGTKPGELTQLAENVTQIYHGAFYGCRGLSSITIPNTVKSIGDKVFYNCTGLGNVTISASVTGIGTDIFRNCAELTEISIPVSVAGIKNGAFYGCSSLKDVYYSGTREQWGKIDIDSTENEALLNAVIHCTDDLPVNDPEETEQPETVDAKQELERLKTGDPFALEKDFGQYLSDKQIDTIESFLYTWLAKINDSYQYSGSSGIKERVMKKAGIDPEGDFASGMEQAVTHISVQTKYGKKTFEITLDLGKPDGSGNLYPAYGAMHFEVLEKAGIPSDVPNSGEFGRDSYTDMGKFIDCVSMASSDSLHHTYQWQSLSDDLVAGILVDKTVTEIIGNKNGAFSDNLFSIYIEPLLSYSKRVKISCPVDVHVYNMNGEEAGSIVDNQPIGSDPNVRLDVDGDTKTVYLTGNDYYLNLRGADTGTMKYEVEEIANKEVCRNVEFLELQLKKDMQYEGYVFRPLNIDQDLYALRTVGGASQEVFYADKDSYQPSFKMVQSVSLSQQNTSLNEKNTVQLSASLLPLDASNPNLKWTTDNESIVTVDSNGLVTAVGAGRATVTVSTKDGSFLKQFCMIDVAERKEDPNGGNNSSGSSSSGGNNSSGSSSSGGNGSFGGSSGSSGWSGSAVSPSVEQEKTPVVVKLHYIVQFDVNGGTNLSRKTMTLLADDVPGIMPKAQRRDYIFDGWYTQQDGGNQVTGDKPLNEATTLYARWTKAAAPAKAAVPTLKSKKKGQIQVDFRDVSGAAGYQIAYSTSRNFTSAKSKEVQASVNTKAITGLKAGKTYYVRIRAYCVDSMGNKIYGAYSTVKSVKVKA